MQQPGAAAQQTMPQEQMQQQQSAAPQSVAPSPADHQPGVATTSAQPQPAAPGQAEVRQEAPASPPAAAPQAHAGGDQLESAIEELRDVVDTMRPTANTIRSSNGGTGQRICGDSFWNIAVDIQAMLGTAELTVRQLLELESGQVLPLDRGLEEPLELVVNGHVIAKAELEKDEHNRLSFRIIELLDTSAEKLAG